MIGTGERKLLIYIPTYLICQAIASPLLFVFEKRFYFDETSIIMSLQMVVLAIAMAAICRREFRSHVNTRTLVQSLPLGVLLSASLILIRNAENGYPVPLFTMLFRLLPITVAAVRSWRSKRISPASTYITAFAFSIGSMWATELTLVNTYMPKPYLGFTYGVFSLIITSVALCKIEESMASVISIPGFLLPLFVSTAGLLILMDLVSGLPELQSTLSYLADGSCDKVFACALAMILLLQGLAVTLLFYIILESGAICGAMALTAFPLITKLIAYKVGLAVLFSRSWLGYCIVIGSATTFGYFSLHTPRSSMKKSRSGDVVALSENLNGLSKSN